MFDPKCAEFEAKIVAAKTWPETKQLMSCGTQWFSTRYKWDETDKNNKRWIEVNDTLPIMP